MSNHRSGCRDPKCTGRSWGDCARAARISTQRLDGKVDRAFDAETERYRQAVKDGLDPADCTNQAVTAAYKAADAYLASVEE